MAIYALGGSEPKIDPDAFVHPDAVVIGNVEIGPGSVVMVTHHVEEIPRAANSVLLLKSGKVLVKGRVNDVLSSENLSNAFSRDVAINTIGGRFFAIANPSGSSMDGVFPNLKSKWSQG